MNSITEQILSVVSDWDGSYKGAYNIREDGGCAGRQSSENIKIEPKKDNPGIVIRISSNAKQETVYIPACVTKAGVNDLVSSAKMQRCSTRKSISVPVTARAQRE